MSQYLRIVSYLYQYQNNTRGKNVGFVKAERRDGICRFQIQVPKYPELADYPNCPVYFYGYKNSDPYLFHLAQTSMKNGQISFRFSKSEQEIFEDAASLEMMEGILVMLSENIYLSSTWKNLDGKDFFHLIQSQTEAAEAFGTDPDHFVILDTTEPSVNELKSTEIKETDINHSTEKKEAEFRKDSPEEKKTEKRVDLFENNEAGNNETANRMDSSQKKDAACEEDSYENREAECRYNSSPEREAADGADLSENRDMTADMEDSIFYNQRNCPEEVNIPAVDMDDTQSVQKEDCRITPDTIFSTYPKLPSFLNHKECIRIEPQDIGILPMKHWGLAGNSFLLHGYYCFHHLLLARCENDSYILGVPGFYHQNEKILATMFGFDSFETINQNPHRNGDYGYFYRMID